MSKRKIGVEQLAATVAIILFTFYIIRYLTANIELQKSDTFIYTVEAIKNADGAVLATVLFIIIPVILSGFFTYTLPKAKSIQKVADKIAKFCKTNIAIVVKVIGILVLLSICGWVIYATEKVANFTLLIVFLGVVTMFLVMYQHNFTKLAIFNQLYIIIAFLMLGLTNISIEAKPKISYEMYYYGKNGNVTSVEINYNNYVITGDKIRIVDKNLTIPTSNILLYEDKIIAE